MRVVFLGKHKQSTVRALEFLVGRGADVAAVVAPEPDAQTAPSSASTSGRSAAAWRW